MSHLSLKAILLTESGRILSNNPNSGLDNKKSDIASTVITRSRRRGGDLVTVFLTMATQALLARYDGKVI